MALERWVFFDVGVLAFASLVAAGAAGLAMRSVRAQVLARGVAWAVLAPSLLGLADSLGHGRLPDPPSVFFGATSAARCSSLDPRSTRERPTPSSARWDIAGCSWRAPWPPR